MGSDGYELSGDERPPVGSERGLDGLHDAGADDSYGPGDDDDLHSDEPDAHAHEPDHDDAGDEPEAEGEELRSGLPPKVDAWRRRSATGAILTGIALGFQQVFEPEKNEAAIVQETSGDPPKDLPVEAQFEHLRPRQSVVNIRPWLLPGTEDAEPGTTGEGAAEDADPGTTGDRSTDPSPGATGNGATDEEP